jgi:hypothetical protein
MKKLLLKSLLGSLLVSAVFAAAYASTTVKVTTTSTSSSTVHVNVLAKLQALKVEELKTVDEGTTLTEVEMKAQDDVFDALEDAVKDSLKDPSNVALQDEIFRVTVVMLKKDPTQFAGEVILPLYEKNRKSYDAALKKLSAEDAQLVKEAVKTAVREKKNGNG